MPAAEQEEVPVCEECPKIPLEVPVSLAEVKAWLNLTDPIDDHALQVGLDAAAAAQATNLTWSDMDYPDDLRQALYLRVARYLARRNSPDGLVGFAEFGPARVARVDADISDLESPHRRVVLA